jgi:hypothetical protein|tara:strand:+ start:364 stop:564 length:201 start_codon:yes stop_codon:yes gene_type:complete
MIMADEYRRVLNLVEDIRRLQIPKIERIEKVMMRTKTLAWTGVGLGAAALGLGAYITWYLHDRGWW